MLRRRFSKRPLCIIALSVLFLSAITSLAITSPTYADENNTVQTTFFGPIEDPGEGCGIYMTLNFVLDILTFGVVIAAAIGITISGITYMSATSNENQVAKARRRIYEITIGLAAYAVMWTFINFLLPGGVMNKDCEVGEESNSWWTEPSTTSTNAKTKTKTNKKTKSSKKGSNKSSSGNSIIDAAEYVANLFENNNFTYADSASVKNIDKLPSTKNGKSNCAGYVSLVMQKAGYLAKGKTMHTENKKVSGTGSMKNVKITHPGRYVKELVKSGELVPGDIIGLATSKPHTMIFKENKNGTYWYINGGKNGTTDHKNSGGHYKASKILNDTYGSCKKGNCKVGTIIHPKN